MDYLVYRHKKTAPWGGGGGLYQRYLNVVIGHIGDAVLFFHFLDFLLAFPPEDVIYYLWRQSCGGRGLRPARSPYLGHAALRAARKLGYAIPL